MVKTQELQLKVQEAIQDDVNKGIVRFDSTYMKDMEIRAGDIVEIQGERKTVAVADRALPGDIGLNIIRMDGLARRNAKTTIGELVKVRKADVVEGKKVIIAPARKGIMIRASPQIFKRGLLGRATMKGDIIALGGTRRRRSAMSDNPFFDEMFSSILNEDNLMNFGLGDLKFVVVDVAPAKKAILITENTQVIFNPEAVEVKDEQQIDVTYEDVGGLDDELTKIREMVELPLKHPEIFERLGIEPPKGVLLHGPPGTGKTLLAKAVANETNSNFLLINGPEIMSKYYGQSEENLRKKFEEAEKNAPSIIFIDEIDAIASKREESKGEVERRVVAQLLTMMDGLKTRGKVVVIAATNIPNQLDPALRRPGRFDREIEIGVPKVSDRLNVLKIHTRNMPLLGSLYADILKTHFESDYEIKSDISRNPIGNDIKERIKANKSDFEKIHAEMLELDEELDRLEYESKQKGLIATIKNKINKTKDTIDELKKEKTQKTKELASLEEEFEVLNSNLSRLKQAAGKLKDSKQVIERILNDLITLQSQDKTFGDERDTIIKNYKDAKEREYVELLVDTGLISQELIDSARSDQRAINKDMERVAAITHGFVGADLAALAKESAMIVLRRVLPDINLQDEEELPAELLEKLIITQADFLEALKVVRPSALREVLIETPNIGYADIGGLDDVKQELIEAVEWPLKHKEAFSRLGVKPPKGVLLYGPPGTGKTLLAKAVAKESESNFIPVKGPEMLSKWVGESEKAVRKIFEKARQTSPCVLFFDEIDSIAPHRNQNSESEVTERVVNQLLTEMDGLQDLNDVVIVAATNRPDILDTALLRPGRFDRIILVPVPEKEGRKQIFDVHLSGMKLAKDVDVKMLVDRTEGYVGADIAAVCREAAMLALRDDIKAKEVTMAYFEKALQKVRPSVNKQIEEAYKGMQDQFRQARGKQMAADKPSYYG